jgi:ABC-type phosphate/phosphonate transport system substrate-binding protein
MAYLQEKARDPGIVPLLIENDADEIIFCVSLQSRITNLAQLVGRSVGFGDANSSVTIQAQHCLLTNGLRKSDLGPIEYLASASHVSKANLPEFGAAEIVTDMREIKGGREALRSLLEGKIDAAVTLKRYFEVRRHRGTGLRIIGKVPGWPEVFAARAGLDPRVLDAFRNAMLSLEHSPGLGTLSSYRTVSGVLATDDRYFDGLRMALTNVQQNFESRPPLPSDNAKAAQP